MPALRTFRKQAEVALDSGGRVLALCSGVESAVCSLFARWDTAAALLRRAHATWGAQQEKERQKASTRRQRRSWHRGRSRPRAQSLESNSNGGVDTNTDAGSESAACAGAAATVTAVPSPAPSHPAPAAGDETSIVADAPTKAKSARSQRSTPACKRSCCGWT